MGNFIFYQQNGELNKAEQLLHIALKTAQETQNELAITYIFDLLANLAYQREEYSKAEKLFKEVLQRMFSGMKYLTNYFAVIFSFFCINSVVWYTVYLTI